VCVCAVPRQGRIGIGWGRAELQRRCHGGAAAEHRRWRSGLECGLRSMIASARGGEDRVDAHRRSELAGEAAQGVNVDGGRRRTDRVGEEVAAEVLLAPGLRGSAQSGAVKVTQELGSTETRRRRSILVEAELTGNGGRGEIRRRERARRG
jgi:hypothetical protein